VPTNVISPTLKYLKSSPLSILKCPKTVPPQQVSKNSSVPPQLVPTTDISSTLIYLKSSPWYPKNVPKPVPPKYVPKQISVLPQLIPTTGVISPTLQLVPTNVISPTLNYLKSSPRPILKCPKTVPPQQVSKNISVPPQLVPTTESHPNISQKQSSVP
jgi:hypothetical protein